MNEVSFRKPQAAETGPLIELIDIRKTFVTGGGVEVNALRGVSLTIYPGEFIAIMGASGSGKSTLMNIVGCLDRATSGDYLFGSQDIATFDADALAWLRREAFGFVFQSYNLLPSATAEENVEIPAIYAGLTPAQRKARAEELLTALGLGDRMEHRPNQLSGGQQQRVSIARALMNGGQIILADEPTGALDSKSGTEVMALLKDLAKRGHTVILITHDAAVAAHANRVIELRDGLVVKDNGTKSASPSETAIPIPKMDGEHKSVSRFSGTSESLRMAVRSLRGNMFRTVLTLLGIMIGVASVVALLAIGQGTSASVIQRISSMGTNLLTVQPENDRGGGQRGGASSSLTFDDASAVVRGVDNVKATLPEIRGNMTLRYGNADYQTQVTATSASVPDVRSWPVSSGVFFSDADNDAYLPVAVLGKTVVDNLMPGVDPIGEYVLINSVPFQVVGTMSVKGSSGFGGQDQDNVVFVPLKTGGLRLFGQTFLRSLTVAVDDVEKIDQTEAELIQFLKERHGTEDFSVRNSAELLENVSSTTQTLTIFLGSVAAISLLVGGIGIMNIMLVSVTERTREIGIRMATGARQRDILQQFLSEAVLVSAMGGIIGVLIGIGAGLIFQAFGVPVQFTAPPILTAFGCAAATGLLFGYAPARKAAQLDPVVALSNE